MKDLGVETFIAFLSPEPLIFVYFILIIVSFPFSIENFTTHEIDELMLCLTRWNVGNFCTDCLSGHSSLHPKHKPDSLLAKGTRPRLDKTCTPRGSSVCRAVSCNSDRKSRRVRVWFRTSDALRLPGSVLCWDSAYNLHFQTYKLPSTSYYTRLDCRAIFDPPKVGHRATERRCRLGCIFWRCRIDQLELHWVAHCVRNCPKLWRRRITGCARPTGWWGWGRGRWDLDFQATTSPFHLKLYLSRVTMTEIQTPSSRYTEWNTLSGCTDSLGLFLNHSRPCSSVCTRWYYLFILSSSILWSFVALA